MPEQRVRVAVDAMGGDHAPAEIVAGAVAAARDHGLEIVLVGKEPEVRRLLTIHGVDGQVEVVPADQEVRMHEGALSAWRRTRSSVAIGCELVRSGQAQALVSAGSTSAVVAAATRRLGTAPGVLRPAIAVILPTRPSPMVLLDVGATADPSPAMLVQFALLGTAYAGATLGVADPRVGLLSIGAEPEKGNRLARRAHAHLAAAPVRFVGNVEGGDLLAGAADVVVTDGFTGNVVLKSLEGALRFAVTEIRDALTAHPVARLAALPHRGRLRRLASRFDPDTYGGAALLGLSQTVVIVHGAARARAVTNACLLARDLAGTGVVTQPLAELRPAAGQDPPDT
ncbi:phosphate acyltransferase [Carbonactinospora thermoautotrophica]|nr:phosphate acyltransferase PlsX [Carbonactinospora thermoautotrophica]KWX00149.1 phosphate acyltransferase [Carbonactinospora thermoautotrophica]